MAYSENLLINPSAEFGTNGWEYDSTSAYVGGTKGSYSFKISATGHITQAVDFSTEPTEVVITTDYWLIAKQDPLDITVRGKVLLKLFYADNTFDTYMYPFKGAYGRWNAIRETITFDDSEPKPIRATLTAECINLPGGVLIDNTSIIINDGTNTGDVDTGKYDNFWQKAILYGLDKDKPLLRG